VHALKKRRIIAKARKTIKTSLPYQLVTSRSAGSITGEDVFSMQAFCTSDWRWIVAIEAGSDTRADQRVYDGSSAGPSTCELGRGFFHVYHCNDFPTTVPVGTNRRTPDLDMRMINHCLDSTRSSSCQKYIIKSQSDAAESQSLKVVQLRYL